MEYPSAPVGDQTVQVAWVKPRTRWGRFGTGRPYETEMLSCDAGRDISQIDTQISTQILNNTAPRRRRCEQ